MAGESPSLLRATIVATMTYAHRSATPISTHDTTRIDDTRIKAVRPLITPALLQEWLPTPLATQTLVEKQPRRHSARAVWPG